tara:strand:+ start:1327 stop:2064 length:738 start_codon:yes stop_codon:yes gene_type:complete
MLLAQTIGGLAEENVQYVLIQPTRLDFLIVLIGVVVGLSIGRLVTFSGQIIINRDVVTWHPTFLIYMLALFTYQIFYWWSAWDLKGQPQLAEDFTFLSYARLLLMPLFIYGATAVLCKDLRDVEEFSMKEHFTDQARAFYLIVGALIVTALLQAIFLWDKTWENNQSELALRGIAFLIVLTAFFLRPNHSQIFHLFLSLVILGLLVYFIYISESGAEKDNSAALETASPARVLLSDGSAPQWRFM